MSFDMFVNAYEGTDLPVVIPRETFEHVFGDRVAVRDHNFWRVAYPDGGGADIYLSEYGCMVNQAGGEIVFDALVRFLREAGAVVYWPGGGCAIADEAVRPKIAPGLVEACGPPERVSTGRQLIECIVRV